MTGDPTMPVKYLKGHGTGNDFVILPDERGRLALTPERVAALCDRRFGIGADGVLRAVMCQYDPASAGLGGDAAWFMDYRNADGSLAETCGNGARVFARYLVDAGLAPAGRVAFATRGGIINATAPEHGDVSVGMGRASALGQVKVSLAGRSWSAVGVAVPNPHAVVLSDDDAGPPFDEVPQVEPLEVFPDGANVEFVQVLSADRVRMRVYERGVGPTLSCGSGACAAAWVHRKLRPGGNEVVVEVPGGVLRVGIGSDRSMVLTGPAVLVAEGRVFSSWWDE